MELTATTAIVTGAGAGLGRALAVGLAQAGAGVVVADIDAASAAETAAQVSAHGVAASVVQADVRRPDDARRLVSDAVALGGPHVLVNNAGGWSPGEQFPAAPPEVWGAAMTLNLLAPMRLCQLVLAPMACVGGGAVVNIASSAGIGDAGYGSPEYAAAKAGLIRFTSSLADLEATHRVRVTCVVPGWIGLERAHAQLAAMSDAERAVSPPLVPPEDIVAVTLDLVRRGRSGAVVELLRGGEPPRLRDPRQP